MTHHRTGLMFMGDGPGAAVGHSSIWSAWLHNLIHRGYWRLTTEMSVMQTPAVLQPSPFKETGFMRVVLYTFAVLLLSAALGVLGYELFIAETSDGDLTGVSMAALMAIIIVVLAQSQGSKSKSEQSKQEDSDVTG